MDASHVQINNPCIQDFEFISTDPKENADNFDPKWAYFKEMTTDEERYKFVRKRWGNRDIPDPSVNLTYRQPRNAKLNEKENVKIPKLEDVKVVRESRPTGRSMERTRKPRRSRSCTRPYERLIDNLEKNYFAEYCNLMFQHNSELQEMLQIQSMQNMYNSDSYFDNNCNNLQILQQKEVLNLLTNQFQRVKNLIGEQREYIEACKLYMEEVKAFFLFYQKINDSEVLLQMTDEQYEHTVETERMYELYTQFYGSSQ